ncbi:MAG: hypothetical protein ABEJ34_00770 [Haloferacaceae archaeon]
MDWKRERDGLAVVVGIVVVVGILAAGGSIARFATTLVATFLGVLLALQVAGRGGLAAAGAATPVPAAGGRADREETGDELRPDAGTEPSAGAPDGEPTAHGEDGGGASSAETGAAGDGNASDGGDGTDADAGSRSGDGGGSDGS